MAITSAVCTSFKQELGTGTHDLENDTLKVALLKASPTGDYGADTTNYSEVTTASDEATGTGYTAGGATLVTSASTDGTSRLFDWADVQWLASTISADGAIVYNSSKSNKAIMVIDFGSTKSSSNSKFEILWPTPVAATAALRIE